MDPINFGTRLVKKCEGSRICCFNRRHFKYFTLVIIITDFFFTFDTFKIK